LGRALFRELFYDVSQRPRVARPAAIAAAVMQGTSTGPSRSARPSWTAAADVLARM
jgi:hypothetical protein